MPNVHFYLKTADGKPAKSLIFLQFKYNGERLVYSFVQRIAVKNWSHAKQRVKSNKVTTEDGQYSLNDLLDKLARALEKGYNNELVNGIPTKDRLVKYLDKIIYQDDEKDSIFTLFDRFISGEIKNKGKDKSSNTLQNYATVKKHLLGFAKKARYNVGFETVNLDFFYKFTKYLKEDEDLKLKHNTIAKDITILKTIMGEAVDLGFTTNIQFRHKKFSMTEEETDSIYLTEKEIIKLYHHDFSSNPKLEQVRDLFVVGCFTGLRYSDYSNISPDNIVETDGDLFIKMITQKTKELVIIPCNPIILNIFEKYEKNPNRLPNTISSQKFNDYIKEACEAAKFTEKGRLSTEPGKELWQSISSHTARRSFATNLYLEGFPNYELMKITGHKTEKAFFKYIKVSKLESAKRLSDHIKKNWSGKLLKVAS
jgi:integrase